MVWVPSASPVKRMPLCLYSRQVRNHGLGVLCGTCKEYADCLYSRQVRNHGLGVLCGACKEYAAVPLLQTSQKSEWPGCPLRHLQQSMRTASAPVLFQS